MKFWRFLGHYFSTHWIRLVACLIFGIIIVIINNATHGTFTSLFQYSNGLFIGGAILFLFGLLTVVNYFGGLDIFSYMFRARKTDGHRESLYDYSERKKVERKPAAFNFIDYLIVGTIFMIVAIII